MTLDLLLDMSWKKVLNSEFEKPYFKTLSQFIENEYVRGNHKTVQVYPQPDKIFRAFNTCPFEKVLVVIVGQDPYHGDVNGIPQAIGLSFAVPDTQPLPPSLKNIFKEIESDIGIKPFSNNGLLDGDLSRWATQGVLLLNATLTVRAHAARSHQNKGWEQFTDEVIKRLSDNREHIVFMLWGKYAQAKGVLIDQTKHLVLKAVHPSPFSVYAKSGNSKKGEKTSGGFFGCKHFSQTNSYLKKWGKKEIDWR